NMSSDNLCSIFQDNKLLRSTMRSICILDGDQYNKGNYSNFTIVLPGKKSPEDLMFDYVQHMYETNDLFWKDSFIMSLGYTKIYYRDKIKKGIEYIQEKLDKKKQEGSIKGIKREENKKLFNKYKQFFELIMKNWINSPSNKSELDKFYKDLKIMFKKVCEFHDISSKEWKD
ncbi:MAG: ATP-binding protein, partial [Clostridia bacterium]|nr:ATP-binding protein [Clostridia bacterium]